MNVNTVSFPGLGLSFEINRYAFVIFGIEIYWYGVIIAAAFLLAVLLALRSCRNYDLTSDNIFDIVLFAAPVAIIFARLYYVIFSWDQYKDDPISILRIRDGGLAIYGAVIGALLVAWLYARRKKISFLHLADFCIPYLAMGQGIGRWGNFVNQEAFGTVTDLPWRMNGNIVNKYILSVMPDADLTQWGVHPTFLYESVWDIAVFLFLLFYRKRKKVDGEVFFLYLMLYGAGRAYIEGLRTDSLPIGSLRVSQILSVILLVAALILFIYRRIRWNRADMEPAVLGQSKYGTLLQRMKEEEAAEAAAAGNETGTDEDGEKAAAEDDKVTGESQNTRDDKGTGREDTTGITNNEQNDSH